MLSRQCIIFSIIFVVDSFDMTRTTTPWTTKNTAFICHSVWTAGFGHKSTRFGSIILFEMDCMNKCINLLKCYGFSVVTFDRTCCINIYRKLFNSDRTREFGILASKLVDFFSEIWHSFRLCGSRSSSLTFSFLSFTHTVIFPSFFLLCTVQYKYKRCELVYRSRSRVHWNLNLCMLYGHSFCRTNPNFSVLIINHKRKCSALGVEMKMTFAGYTLGYFLHSFEHLGLYHTTLHKC